MKALQAFLIQALLRGLSWLPLRVNHALGAGLGYLLWWTPNSVKRVSRINLATAFPDHSPQARQALLKQSLLALGQTVTELGALWFWSRSRTLALVQAVEGGAQIEQALAEKKGVIVLSPHLGAWEMMGYYWAAHYPMTSLYRPPNLAALESFMQRVRERGGARLVPTDRSGVKALREALKRNEMIGILPDQDPGKRGSVHAPFFGYPARTMLLVSKLAAKSGAPVFFTFAERLPIGKGYRVHILPAPTEVAALDAEAAATALNQGVEQCVRIAPAQYQWSYKRYKHPPAGVANPYKSQS
ncbi:lysophospholipid acyltransferase family protein [Thiomicrospira sp. WB1]|uniref:lysophospholipid acyltransferase family protein n=1 Tax=Thiomicrospira sp. WB1 TaxID=1685380 RepID=UPI000747C1FC|nr:lysophospholipid acyltransferase family protein [Thiomicrospira sp. WB1]KUJ71208.1 lipid A biosynthesis acyltransferase [Thiomicrospira sp. WB1]